MTWLSFLAAVMPDLLALARLLFVQSGGNAVEARARIARVGDYGAKLDAERLAVDREMDAARPPGER